MSVMNRRIYFIVGVIVLSILISGCIQQISEEEPKAEEPEELQQEQPQIEEEPEFNISIFFIDGNLYRTAKLSYLELPIDSEQEACDLFNDVQLSNRYTCNFTEQLDYWLFSNGLISVPICSKIFINCS